MYGRLNMEEDVDCVIVDAGGTESTNAATSIEEEMGKAKPTKGKKKDPIQQFLGDTHIGYLKKTKPGKMRGINTLEAIPNVQVEKCEDERMGYGLFNGSDKLLKGRNIGAYFGKITLDNTAHELEEYVQVTEDAWIIVHTDCKMKYVNHSCEPNSHVAYAKFNDLMVPVVRTSRDIQPHEEITIDYEWMTLDASKLKEPCLCNAAQCKQFLYSPPTRYIGPEIDVSDHNIFYQSIDIYSSTDQRFQHLAKGIFFERRPTKEEIDFSAQPFIYKVVAIGRKQKPASMKDKLVIYGQFFRRGDDEVVNRVEKCSPKELLATFCFEEVDPKLFLNIIILANKPNSKQYFQQHRFFSEDQEKIFDIPPTTGYDSKLQEEHLSRFGYFALAPEEKPATTGETEPKATKIRIGKKKNETSNNNNNNQSNTTPSARSSTEEKTPTSVKRKTTETPMEQAKDRTPLVLRKKGAKESPSPATESEPASPSIPQALSLAPPISQSPQHQIPMMIYPSFPVPAVFDQQDSEFAKFLDDLTDLYSQFNHLDMGKVTFWDLCQVDATFKRMLKKTTDAMMAKAQQGQISPIYPSTQHNNN